MMKNERNVNIYIGLPSFSRLFMFFTMLLIILKLDKKLWSYSKNLW